MSNPSLSMNEMELKMGLKHHQIKKIINKLIEDDIPVIKTGVDLKTGKILKDQRSIRYAILSK